MIKINSPLTPDAEKWYKLHGVDVRKDRLIFDTPCQALDLETNKCKIYESRPLVCKQARVGGDCCLWSRIHMKGKGMKIGDDK